MIGNNGKFDAGFNILFELSKLCDTHPQSEQRTVIHTEEVLGCELGSIKMILAAKSVYVSFVYWVLNNAEDNLGKPFFDVFFCNHTFKILKINCVVKHFKGTFFKMKACDVHVANGEGDN